MPPRSLSPQSYGEGGTQPLCVGVCRTGQGARQHPRACKQADGNSAGLRNQIYIRVRLFSREKEGGDFRWL